ncbi:MAG: YwaF family protein [Clostridia bacterium]|nr:YwaF family protein [Clostridia bacterium]
MITWLLSGCAVSLALSLIIIYCPTVFERSRSAEKFYKTVACIFLALSFVEMFLPDLWSWRFCDAEDMLKELHDPAFSLVRLLSSSLIAVIPVSYLYPKKNLMRFSGFFGVLSFVFDFIYAETYINNAINAQSFPFGDLFKSFFIDPVFRISFFLILETLKLFLALSIFKRRREELAFSGIWDAVKFILISIPLLIVNIQPQFFGQFFGTFTDIEISSLNFADIIWLISIPIQVAVYTLIFRKRSEEDKNVLLSLLSLSLCFQFTAFFRSAGLVTIARLPFQLCNFGCYLIVAAVITKCRKFGVFAASINVIGALLAVIVCSTPGECGLFYTYNMHYILEHNGIIVVSLLLLTLNVITPLKLSDAKTVFWGYNIYYFSVFIIGTAFNTVSRITNNDYFSCNYLFMFDKDAAVEVLPFIGKLFDMKVTLWNFAEFSIVQLVVYFVFLAMCMAMFSLFLLIFRQRSKADI